MDHSDLEQINHHHLGAKYLDYRVQFRNGFKDNRQASASMFVRRRLVVTSRKDSRLF
jgi:hypothetical protein